MTMTNETALELISELAWSVVNEGGSHDDHVECFMDMSDYDSLEMLSALDIKFSNGDYDCPQAHLYQVIDDRVAKIVTNIKDQD